MEGGRDTPLKLHDVLVTVSHGITVALARQL
jgi:hypothetical protein